MSDSDHLKPAERPAPIDAPPHEPQRAWVGDKGTIVRTSQLWLEDYPTERFGVACGVCLRSIPECAKAALARYDAITGGSDA